MKQSIVILAREPSQATVKSSLLSYLTPVQCTQLHKAFLKDALDLAQDLDCDQRVIAYDSGSGEPSYLKEIARDCELYSQTGESVGSRIHDLFQRFCNGGERRVIVMGSDAPTLPLGYIQAAFARLREHDVVIGPARCGNYYLIGSRKPCAGLFRDVEWNSENICVKTLANARRLSKKFFLLPEWYDVGTTDDLIHLECHLRRNSDKHIARWTRKCLGV